jgi:hypothetical protein
MLSVCTVSFEACKKKKLVLLQYVVEVHLLRSCVAPRHHVIKMCRVHGEIPNGIGWR